MKKLIKIHIAKSVKDFNQNGKTNVLLARELFEISDNPVYVYPLGCQEMANKIRNLYWDLMVHRDRKTLELYTVGDFLINYFGLMVEDTDINSDNVEIIVHKDDGTEDILHYDKEGFVIDWPNDYFDWK